MSSVRRPIPWPGGYDQSTYKLPDETSTATATFRKPIPPKDWKNETILFAASMTVDEFALKAFKSVRSQSPAPSKPETDREVSAIATLNLMQSDSGSLSGSRRSPSPICGESNSLQDEEDHSDDELMCRASDEFDSEDYRDSTSPRSPSDGRSSSLTWEMEFSSPTPTSPIERGSFKPVQEED